MLPRLACYSMMATARTTRIPAKMYAADTAPPPCGTTVVLCRTGGITGNLLNELRHVDSVDNIDDARDSATNVLAQLFLVKTSDTPPEHNCTVGGSDF